MMDYAFCIQHRGDLALAAHDAVDAEFRIQHIEMFYAVEEGNDRRVRTDSRGKRRDRVVEIIGLAAQDDDIERVRDLVRYDGRRVLERRIAGRAFDDKAVLGHQLRALRANQKRHVAARLQQPAAEISAGCASANHENPHAKFHFLLSVRRDPKNCVSGRGQPD